MHEMSIAEGILDIALDYAAKNGGRVKKVGLILGEMSGVETEALDFAWDIITKGTAAEGAKLESRRTELIGRCQKCGREGHVENYNFFCPACGGVVEILSGRELKVEYLDLDEE